MKADQIERIAVIGAGLMGHGIAQEFALAGYDVRLVARSEASLGKALRSISDNLERLIGFGLVTREQTEAVPERIHTTTELEEVTEDADVVIESVYENLELKQEIFRRLVDICPEHTVLASNTSSLMPSALAARARRRDRILVAHYINPPYLVPFVEIVKGPETSDDSAMAVFGLLTKIGKRPIIVQRETPGFVAGRLQGALLREALWLVENGIASAQDVDTAIKTSLGRRWAVAGVFEVLEIAGWDLILAIASGLYPHLASAPEAPQVLKERVERGELGVKTGKGFYEWNPETAKAVRDRIAHALVEIDKWS